MKILLDTCAFLWLVEGSARLSATARALIEDPNNECFLSVASIWEIAIKTGKGKLTMSGPIDPIIPDQLLKNKIQTLAIEVPHALAVATLPTHHADPFDRLLIAQAIVERMPIISSDSEFGPYDPIILW
jgi:PIN domain nuclease of toxin-antitoxin system